MNRPLRILATCLLSLLPWTVQGSSNAARVYAGTLLVDPAQRPVQAVTIIMEGGLVRSIEAGFVEGPGRVIDLKDAFVLPGLIDLHVHLTSPAEPGGELRAVRQGAAELALTALELGQRNLAAGFTTVVDLGTGRRNHEQAIYALRDAIEAGWVMGPRILAAGSPLSPSGASRTGHYRAEVDAAIPPQGECDGADDCRRAVREQVARGADIINVYNSGSLNDAVIAQRTFTDAEFEAIVEAAHALGRKVVADGHTAAGINAALRAGADIVDTAPWPDQESWRLMKTRGAVFVPHLYAFEQVIGNAPETTDPIMQRLHDIKRRPYSAGRAYREGIAIAFGSDVAVIPHGSNAGEFAELVRVGMTPAEAIAAATTRAAGAVGLAHLVGTLEPGKAADMIAVAASPLEDIRELQRVRFVMKGGKVIRNDF